MLSKIYLKDFQKNMKNYLFCFWGIVLSNLFYFCFLKIVSEFYGDNAVKEGFEYHEMQMYQTVIGLVTVLFLILTLKFYIESRKESYRITMILGESGKTTGCRLLMECLFLWGGSSLMCIAFDLAGGAVLDYIFRNPPEIFWDGILSGMKYNMLIWLAGIGICSIGLFRQKHRRRRRKQNGKKMPYCQTAGFVAGVLLAAGSIGYYRSSAYVPIRLFGVMGAFGVGAYCIIKYGFAGAGRIRARITRKYPTVNSRAVQGILRKYSLLHWAVYAITFLLLSYIFLIIMDNQYVDEQWKYPYAEVLITRQGSEVSSVEHRIPTVEVQDTDGRSYWGIAEKSYETLTGESIGLKEQEIVTVTQHSEEDFAEEFTAGKLSFEKDGVEHTFTLKGTENKILFCGYCREVTNVAVFHNNTFEELGKYFPKKDICLLSDESETLGDIVLKRSELLKAGEVKRGITMFFYIGLAVMILIFMNSIAAMSIYSNMDTMQEEAVFYERMGLEKGRGRRKVQSEVSAGILFPMAAAMLAGAAFMLKDGAGNLSGELVKVSAVYYAVFAGGECLYAWWIGRFMWRQVRGDRK